jgi:LmbE family N-acetylglucosaminyl deacetylase
MNPYQKFVSDFLQLAASGKSLPLGGFPAPPKTPPPERAPIAMLFSPHPDDECVNGGLALRLMREAGFRIVNVAVTLGSKKDRRAERATELKNACDWIGFEYESAGLERINPASRTSEPEVWIAAVKTILPLIAKYQPRVILFPHGLDWNTTHVGAHYLVMDALKSLPIEFQTTLIETEFWGQMPAPNLMVELGANDVADLIAALSFHIGEVQRNPYHLRLPAWLQDNVRRGAELVGGQGGTAPDFSFAALYRVRKWEGSHVKELYTGGKIVSAKESPDSILQ